MFAVKQGRFDVVRTLVENGRADVNIKENVSFLPEWHSKLMQCLWICRISNGQQYSLLCKKEERWYWTIC
jgi:hypothetical protein